jgi:hypothetical protein
MSSKKPVRRPVQLRPEHQVVRVVGEVGLSSSVEVKLSELPSPDRIYSADRALIRSGPDDVRFVFIQMDAISLHPSTAVTVRFSKDNFDKVLERTRSLLPTLEEHLRSAGVDLDVATDAEAITEDDRPAKTITERASFERTSYFGGDAEMEFFFLSPAQFQVAKKNHRFENVVRPVLAVTLSSRSLCLLLRAAMSVKV